MLQNFTISVVHVSRLTLEKPEIREFENHDPHGSELYFEYGDEEYFLDMKYSGKMKVKITERSTFEEIYTTWA